MELRPDETNKAIFASVGDAHGHIFEMVRMVEEWEAQTGKKVDFVLQAGDFEPHRNEEDMSTMAAPAKYKRLGDFAEFHSGRAAFPWPVYFIGGNHEPYGLLDLTPQGTSLTDRCFYIGRVGCVEVCGLRIVGISAIYREEKFREKRPPVSEINERSKKDYIYFTEDEIVQALDFGSADILIVHEWPSDIINEADQGEFEQQRRSMRYDQVGNPYARMLMDLLAPKLVICGHMHKSYRNKITTDSGTVAQICCLSNVQQGLDSVAVFRVTSQGDIEEIVDF